MSSKQCYDLWDLPVRLFHWLLLAAIVTAVASVNLGAMTLHVWAGQTILGLVLFRLLWGVFGTRTARFSSFVRSPLTVIAYARSLRTQIKVLHLGHNPMGALSVLALIALTLIQAVSGLFADDDVITQGPLAHLVSSDTREWITSWHKLNFNLLLGMIVLHVLVIGVYWRVGGQNLLRPMVTGKVCASAERRVDGTDNTTTPWMRFVLSVGVAVGGVWLVNVV